MAVSTLAAAVAATLLVATAAFAQTPKSDSSGQRCLRDAQRMPDSTARSPAIRGTCDALIGPDKERCLKQGGTVEAGAKSSAGGTAGGDAKTQ